MSGYYTLTLTDEITSKITSIAFSAFGVESAGYLVCGVSITKHETRLLARDFIPVQGEHYLIRTKDRLSISAESFVPIAKRARLNKEAIIFVHSHPEHYPDFSAQDDREEPKLMEFFYSRVHEMPFGSMVMSSFTTFKARIWNHGQWYDIERIRIIGRRFRFIDYKQNEAPLPEFFDRNIRAFGKDIQLLLRKLHIGIVGASGTGSAIIELLARLGVGKISLFDEGILKESNVTRAHGTGIHQKGAYKVEAQKAHIQHIGFDTQVFTYPKHITDEETAKHLRECDIIFGCTDKQRPRAILNKLALMYLIPIFDMGVKIDPLQDEIRNIWGRVTTLLAGEACLSCRKRIDAKTLRAEALSPEQREQEIREGYIPELATEEPAVITFTTAVAAQAVNELLHRLTGFMGGERASTEVLMLFGESNIRRNRVKAPADCLCQQKEFWGRGDSKNFLGQVWS